MAETGEGCDNKMSGEFQSIMALMQQRFDESFDSDPRQPREEPAADPETRSAVQSKDQAKHLASTALTDESPTVGNEATEGAQEIENYHPTLFSISDLVNQDEHGDSTVELTFESNFTPIKQYQPTFRRPVQSVSDDEAEAEETKDYYNTLTMKLEQALDKISSSKKSVQGGNGFFERLVQFEQKKERDISRRRRENEARLASEATCRPLINSHSEKLIANYEPIHMRADKLAEQQRQKRQRQQEQKQQREQQQQEKEWQELSQWQQSVSKKIGKPRSSQMYYSQMQAWLKKKENYLEAETQKAKQEQMKDATFQPAINSKSKHIMNKHSYIPLHKREVPVRTVPEDHHCTFVPNHFALKK